MNFSSITFLLWFLPLFCGLYWIAPRKLKNILLLLGSLFFYAWGSFRSLWLLAAAVCADYVLGLLLERLRSTRLQKAVLWLGILLHLGVLSACKVSGILPPGISFYTFHALSFLIDVARGDSTAPKNPVRIGLYLCLFPKLIMGPIVSYSELEAELDSRTAAPEDIAAGIFRFCIGLGKKVLLTSALAGLGAAWNDAANSVLSAWLGLLGFSLQLYFDFSGYSDMAVGLGRMFGFHLPENFRYPYLAGSLSEFWRRWHISLGSWFKNYLYFPLGGSRKGTFRTLLNLMIVWLATGIWHGTGWQFVLWGLYFGVLICLEKQWKLRENLPAWLRHILCPLLVMLGWVLFNSADLPSALGYFSALFGGAAAAVNAAARLYLHDYRLILPVSILGATPLPAMVFSRVFPECRGVLRAVSQAVFCLAVLAASFLLLANSTYQPFLYAKF